MKTFTEAYAKAKSVLDGNPPWHKDWVTVLTADAPLKELFPPDGFPSGAAETPDKLRTAIAAKSRNQWVAMILGGGPGDVIYQAAGTQERGLNDRAAAIKFVKHLYRAQKKGGQDVWIYSPPKGHTNWIFDELKGSVASVKSKLGDEDELFSSTDKGNMCAALGLALKIAEDTKIKLSSASDATKALVKHWFLDSNAGDEQLVDAMARLNAGFQKIAVCCNSNKLVFADYPDWHATRNNIMGGAIPGGEGGGFPVVYIEGAFTATATNAGDLWTCARTVIHEFSHHEIRTEDHRYRHQGLKPDSAAFAYAKTITNADSWAVFAVDLAGYLPASEKINFYK